MVWEVGKSYTSKSKNSVLIIHKNNKHLCGQIAHIYVNYDLSGKCQSYACDGTLLDCWDLIPKESYVPWTAQTFPVNEFFKRKGRKEYAGIRIYSIQPDGIRFDLDGPLVTYKELLEHFCTIDGRPAGKKE